MTPQTATAPKSSVTSRAMLVDLTIKRWSASKTDKKVSKDVAQQYGSDESMGHYSKRLVAKEALETISKIAQDASAAHRERTLPWMDGGARILSATGYFEYTQVMRAFETQWADAVKAFADNFSDYVYDAQSKLGGLFNDADYPDDVADRFSFGYQVLPIPDAADFRVALSDDERERIQRSIQESVDAATNEAMRDVANRIVDVLDKMIGKLSEYEVTEDGVKGIFRDSLIGNVRDLVDLLPTLNIANDVRMDAIVERLRTEVCSVSPDALRANPVAREVTVASAESILSDLSAFLA